MLLITEFSAFNLAYLNKLFWKCDKESIVRKIRYVFNGIEHKYFIFTEGENRLANMELNVVLKEFMYLKEEKLEDVTDELCLYDILRLKPEGLYTLSPMSYKHFLVSLDVYLQDYTGGIIKDLCDHLQGKLKF
jgi:hypothetical protein